MIKLSVLPIHKGPFGMRRRRGVAVTRIVGLEGEERWMRRCGRYLVEKEGLEGRLLMWEWEWEWEWVG